MTAPPIYLRRMHARRRAALLALPALLLALAFAFCAPARAADRIKGDVEVFTDGGYARLVFRFAKEVPATISMHFPILIMKFATPVDVAVDRLNAGAPRYISAARIDPDGGAIRIALAHKLKVHSIPAAEKLFVDLLPQTWGAVMPGLPQEVIEDLARRAREAERLLHKHGLAAKARKPRDIRVRVASQPTFTRYVFDVPDGVNVVPEEKTDGLVLNFDQKIRWDLADAIATLPPTLKSIGATLDQDSAAVKFTFNGHPKVRTFREDSSIAVDVASGEGAAKRQGALVPGLAPPPTVPAGDASADKKSEMPAAAPLPKIAAKPEAPKPMPAKKSEAKPATQATAPKVAEAKPAAKRAEAGKQPQAQARAAERRRAEAGAHNGRGRAARPWHPSPPPKR